MINEKNAETSSNEEARAGTGRRRRLLAAMIGVAVVSGITAGAVLLLGSGGIGDVSPTAPAAATATVGHDPYPLVVASDAGIVRFPVETFDDYVARFYTYMHGSQPIEFFVLKSADGVVRVALNACDVCYRSLKGYSQDGDVMVCNNCGSRFPADQINVVRGGCNPSPIERSVEGNDLVLKASDLILGAAYF